jgi:adenylate kinase
MNRTIVIMLGHPGAGKGTQSRAIMRRLGIPQISTGDMLRDAIVRQTSYGQEAKERMDAGELVSDEIVNGIVAERVLSADCAGGFILDGYPRTVQQAQTFGGRLTDDDQLFVIEIGADAQNLLDRLVGRLMCPTCGDIYNVYSHAPMQSNVCDRCGSVLIRRSDDREDLIRERFRTYRDETFPLIEYYDRKGVFCHVDGMRPIEDVTRDILNIVQREGAMAPSRNRGNPKIA